MNANNCFKHNPDGCQNVIIIKDSKTHFWILTFSKNCLLYIAIKCSHPPVPQHKALIFRTSSSTVVSVFLPYSSLQTVNSVLLWLSQHYLFSANVQPNSVCPTWSFYWKKANIDQSKHTCKVLTKGSITLFP